MAYSDAIWARKTSTKHTKHMVAQSQQANSSTPLFFAKQHRQAAEVHSTLRHILKATFNIYDSGFEYQHWLPS